MKNKFPDSEHEHILNNKIADFYSKYQTFKDYCDIGFERKEALSMAGLTEEMLSENGFENDSENNETMHDLAFDIGIPNDLNKAYGKIMDNYAFGIAGNESHEEVVKNLSKMFGVKYNNLENFILQNKAKFFQENYPHLLASSKKFESKIPTIWNGYCPESWAQGKTVRMRLNSMDFYESEETGLQIAIGFPGVQAVIFKTRGEGDFRKTKNYADEQDWNECLSPQTMERQPFCEAVIFRNSEEIVEYINAIK